MAKRSATKTGEKAAAKRASSSPALPNLPPARATPKVAPLPVLSSADRQNPAKLEGEALRKLAHSRGMARSEMVGMPDAKVREQIKYLVTRQYDTEGA